MTAPEAPPPRVQVRGVTNPGDALGVKIRGLDLLLRNLHPLKAVLKNPTAPIHPGRIHHFQVALGHAQSLLADLQDAIAGFAGRVDQARAELDELEGLL